jgi:glycosyltransferase 2 family protein
VRVEDVPAPPAPRRGRMDRVFRTSMLVIAIGVLGNVAFSLLITDRELLGSLAAFPRHYLALAIALGLVPWVTHTLRLHLWTWFLGHKIGVRESFKIVLATELGSSVSPTAVGGAFFKWGMLVQRGVRPGTAASITTLPTVEDAIFFLFALPTAIYLSRAWELPIFQEIGGRISGNLAFAALGLLAVVTLVWLLLRLLFTGRFGERARAWSVNTYARVRRRLRTVVGDGLAVFRLVATRGGWRLPLSLGLTATGWIARYSVISALAAFLGAPVDPVLFWLFQWVVFTFMAFVPTPGATGGAEAAFFLIYGSFLPERVIGLATSGWRFLTFYLQLAIAAILFTVMSRGGKPARAG